MNDTTLLLILCSLRGAGNVGSILRTADAAGVDLVYACGYTPYPPLPGDDRPPHVISSNLRAIRKTALGAELTVPVQHVADAATAVAEAKRNGFDIIVIEQAESSLNLFEYRPTGKKLALIFGNEVDGVEPGIMALAGVVLELPMGGLKESLNVAAAAAISLYQLRYGRPR